jgi:DNA-binding transcriptional LysR family regulator
MIEFRHMRYFIEAARLQHVTRAAENLHIAQPALSQNIAQLERELGVALFLRRKKRLQLTDAGQAFWIEATKTLEQFERAKLIAQRAGRGEVGKLAIGFGTTAGVTVLPAMIRRFRMLYPEPELVLRELFGDAQIAGLRSGELDVAMGYTAIDEQEFAIQALKEERLLVILPETHVLAGRQSIRLIDLREESLILPKRDVAGVVIEAVLAACTAAHFEPRFAHTVETPNTAYALVSAGAGVSIAPASASGLERKGVVARPIRDIRSKVQLRMFWRKGDGSPLLNNFVRCWNGRRAKKGGSAG